MKRDVEIYPRASPFCTDCRRLTLENVVRRSLLFLPLFLMLPPPFVQRASWIWSAEGTHAVPAAGQASPSHYQVRYFRRSFDLAALSGAKLAVHLSADSRYVFYCNGVCLGRGPAKGDINHHFYDTF